MFLCFCVSFSENWNIEPCFLAFLSETAEDDVQGATAAGNPHLERITPSSAHPGDLIALIGQGFSSVGYCVFFDSTTTLQSRSSIVDSSQVNCEVPELLSSMSLDVMLKYVSISGTSSGSVSFKYLEPSL